MSPMPAFSVPDIREEPVACISPHGYSRINFRPNAAALCPRRSLTDGQNRAVQGSRPAPAGIAADDTMPSYQITQPIHLLRPKNWPNFVLALSSGLAGVEVAM